ncbi:tetratricopeptide repeat protein [Ferrovibrio xuzhouensis]|uniref:Tetratricopeptide repeat protein n=1 Tax=Ferrovibrio xuzhouensis TaxID=1576914 RepID=A0ABV7VBN8_9PROT
MKLNLLLVVVIALAALAASIAVVPRRAEQALMMMRSGNFDGAQTLLEENIADGNLKAGTIRPLVDLYLENGTPERAIDALELFVGKRPDDPKALRLLADLQHQVDRFGDEEKTRKALYAVTGDIDTLHDYFDLAIFRDDRTARRWALTELVRTGKAEAEDYIQLARYQGIDGKADQALDTLDTLARSQPREVDDGFVDLYTVIAGTTYAARLQATLLDWLRKGSDADSDNVEAVLSAIVRRNGSAAALAVIAAADREPALARRHAEAFAAVEAANGRSDAALARLTGRDNTAPLPPNGRRLLFELALDAGRFDLAVATFDTMTDRRIADAVAILDAAPEKQKVSLAARLRGDLSEAAMAAQPLLAARFALAESNKTAAKSWLAQVREAGLGFEDRVLLGQVLLQLGDNSRGLAVMAALAGDPRLPPENFSDLAEAYTQLKRQGEGAALLAAVRAKRPRLAPLDAAWARLAAASGDAGAVADWISQAAPRDAALLTDLYYIGSDAAHWPLALAAVQRLSALQPTPDHAALQARALLALNRPKEALPLLAGLPPETPDATELALEAARQTGADVAAIALAALNRPGLTPAGRHAIIGTLTDSRLRLVGNTAAIATATEQDLDAGNLSGDDARARLELLTRLAPAKALPRWQALAAAGDPAAGDATLDLLLKLGRRDEAVTLLASRMEHARDRKQAEADLYALIDIGGDKRALPYLKQAATRWGGDWQSSYEAALEKLGRRDELIADITRTAGNDRTPVTERRAAAFRLLELGAKAPAEETFRQLAEREGPDGDDTQQLLYLWGPRPGAAGLDWLERRARAANDGEQRQWLQLLLDHGGGDRVAALLGHDDSILRQPARLDLLVDYLAGQQKTREAEDWLLRAGKAARQDGGRLAALLGRAEDLGLPHAVAGLARDLATADPNDREAIRRLALAAYGGGRRSEALKLYARYLAGGPADWQSHYNYGELLLAGQKRSEAADQYRAALAIIDRQHRPSDAAVRARPFLLGRLGRTGEMDRTIAGLLKTRPDDTGLRTDLAGLLIDLGRLDEAERIINP